MSKSSEQNRRDIYVIGNWKMQGSQQRVIDFFNELAKVKEASWTQQVKTAICPPFPYLLQMSRSMSSFPFMSLGAQDVSEHENGAYTGQVSASMLVDCDCRYVLVGHSERRQHHQESDHLIAKKFLMAKKNHLIPILCVGETLEEREQNKTESVILSQIRVLLEEGIGVFEGAMIAYEPVWAIGTGKTATPDEAQAIHHLLRKTLAEYDATLAQSLSILYGGSVKPSNAEALFSMQDIDGGLVGGASLLASDFIALCEAGAKCTE